MISAKVSEYARTRPDRAALIYGDETITYSVLDRKVHGAARLLESRGVGAGDRVMLTASSVDPSFVYGYLACHRLGAIAVPIEAKIAPARRDALAADARPRLMFLDAPASASFPALALASLDADEEPDGPMRPSQDDVADILYTTGSTGKPKGVLQTHAGIAAFAAGRWRFVGAGGDDRVAIPVPLSHGYGLGRLRATLFHGGTSIVIPGFLFPKVILDAIERHQAAGLCCVPSGFAALFQLSGDALGSHGRSLRYVETGTAPLHAAQRRRLLTLLPKARLFNTYGLTETTSTFAYHPISNSAEREGCVGELIAGIEARILDADGRQAKEGEAGELLLRGPSVMRGYWNDPERTRAAIQDGWLRTADVAYRDEDGMLHLKGRGDDLINIGGFKIAPAEIEAALMEHPSVNEAACIAIRDPDGFTGEAIKAFLVVKPGASRPSSADLAHFLIGRLEHHKIPSIFAWVDSLPTGVSGKILRGLLRAARLAS